MGKIGVSATKYIIHAKIDNTGTVEKPDVIGAIFGQTEGLLGKELELRELQKGGRIGRIEVQVSSVNGKTTGTIKIPTSLSKENTALIAASLETIERIGPCDSKISIEKIEDVRTEKRDYVVNRAKALLSSLGQDTPGSTELSDQVKVQIRTGTLKEYGPDKLAGGPTITTDKNIILVEGRADVLNLLRFNIDNILSVGGTNTPASLKELCKGKEITVFLDGDRGGDLILKSLVQILNVDYVARAPTGIEVEEMSQKDIIRVLRSKITIEEATRRQANTRFSTKPRETRTVSSRPAYPKRVTDSKYANTRSRSSGPARKSVPSILTDTTTEFKKQYSNMGKIAVGMAGSGKACILKQSGDNFREIGKVPISDLSSVLKNLQKGAASALIIDDDIDQLLINNAALKEIKYLLGHRKPYSIKGAKGVRVLSVRDIIETTADAGKTKKGGSTK